MQSEDRDKCSPASRLIWPPPSVFGTAKEGWNYYKKDLGFLLTLRSKKLLILGGLQMSCNEGTRQDGRTFASKQASSKLSPTKV